MSAFPDLTPALLGVGNRYRVSLVFGPKSIHARGGAQFTAFRKFRRPRYVFDIAWTQLELPLARQINAHVRDHVATFYSFDWFDWYPWWWRSVFVGVGDGATTRWVLPGKEITDATIYVGGSTIGSASDRQLIGGNLVAGVGPNLETAVDLFAPPPAGRPVWAYFFGRRRWTARVDDDMQQEFVRDLETGRYSVGMRLVQEKVTTW